MLAGDGERTAFFGLGTGDAGVGFGLIGLQAGADIFADVDIGDVDRYDLEGRLRSSPRASTAFEIMSGFSMTTRWLSAEPIEVMIPSPTRAMTVSSVAPPISCLMLVRTRDAGPNLQLDAVGDGAEGRLFRFLRIGAIDHFRIDARLHGVEHVAAGKVDRGCTVEVEVDVGASARR